MNNIIMNNSKMPLFRCQLDSVKKILENKKSILSADTGCGKSYIMTAVILNMYYVAWFEGKKIIFTAPTKVVDKLEKILLEFIEDKRVLRKTTGASDRVNRLINNLEETTIILCTHSAWGNLEFSCLMNNLAKNDQIMTLLCDECSLKNNESLQLMLNLAQYIEYVIYANATPVASKSDNRLDNLDKFHLIHRLLYSLGYFNLDYNYFKRRYVHNISDTVGNPHYQLNQAVFHQDFAKYFVNINRSDLGIEVEFEDVIFHRCITNSTNINTLYFENLNDNNAFNTLLDLVIQNRNNKILIYTRRIEIMYIMQEYIRSLGIDCLTLNGTDVDNVLEILDKYHNLPSGVLITNYTEGVDIGSSNTLICYNAPSDILQFVARGVRGFNKKSLTLHFIYYPEVEMETIESIVSQLLSVKQMLNRNVNLLQYFEEELRLNAGNA